MATFTTEDRLQAEQESIPFYGYCYLSDPSTQIKNQSSNLAPKKSQVEYRIDDSSEDLEE